MRVQMVNVQSNDQFGSHQLNRDTWSDPTVASIVMGSFVFWQVGLIIACCCNPSTHISSLIVKIPLGCGPCSGSYIVELDRWVMHMQE